MAAAAAEAAAGWPANDTDSMIMQLVHLLAGLVIV
jgi:hypothetical protein